MDVRQFVNLYICVCMECMHGVRGVQYDDIGFLNDTVNNWYLDVESGRTSDSTFRISICITSPSTKVPHFYQSSVVFFLNLGLLHTDHS